METAISNLKLLPESKEQVNNFANMIKTELLEGGMIDPIELDLRLKFIEELIKKIRKDEDIKRYTIEQALLKGKSFKMNNALISVQSKRTYDYSDDIVWNELNKRIKEREQFLKSIPEFQQVADTETGEMIIRAKSTESTSLKYILK